MPKRISRRSDVDEAKPGGEIDQKTSQKEKGEGITKVESRGRASDIRTAADGFRPNSAETLDENEYSSSPFSSHLCIVRHGH